MCQFLRNIQALCLKDLINPVIKQPGKLFAADNIHFRKSFPINSVNCALYSKHSGDISKKPKIRTYVNYEKDFVQLDIGKCYTCYAIAAAIAAAVAYEIWSNVKDIKPLKSAIGSTSAIQPSHYIGNEKNNKDQGNDIFWQDNTSAKIKGMIFSWKKHFRKDQGNGILLKEPR